MKMFRLPAGLIALLMLGLAGCGTQSPDFTAKLLTFSISPSSGNVPLGDTLQFTSSATCSTPPGSAQTTASCTPDIQWTVQAIPNSSGKGTISNTGLFTGTAPGDVSVVASAGGQSSTAKVTVGPGVIKTLVVTPQNQSVGQGASVNYLVEATYSDSPNAVVPVRGNDTIEWKAYVPGTSTDSMVATVNPGTGSTTTATAGMAAGVATITACSPDCASASKVTGTSTLTVTNVALTGLQTQLTPSSATVPLGQSATYQVKGSYSDGSTAVIPNSSVDWSVDDTTVAQASTVDPAGNSYMVTGIKKGSTTVRAALKSGTYPSVTGANRNSSGTFSVTDAFCTTPLVQPTASTSTSVDPLCLLCSVDQPDNVIDSNTTNYASLISTVGLLMSNVTLTVNSTPIVTQTPAAAGQTVGFVIDVPPGALLSAEVLLSQYSVKTLANGSVVETFTHDAASTLPPILDLTLLGSIGGKQTVLVSGVAKKPFDALSISFGTGVASLLTTTHVYSACASVDTSKVTITPLP